ncbi:MAG: YaiO family outer membrane beta-barrel protein [Rhodoferax sp.]
MNRWAKLVWVGLGFCSSQAALAQSQDLKRSVAVAHTQESLSNGSPDWRELELRVGQRLTPQNAWGLGVRQTRRFGLDDTTLEATYSAPLASGWVGTLEGGFSPDHRVMPSSSLSANLQYEFAPAWLVHLGAKSTQYDTGPVSQASLMLERYISSFSVLAAWRPARALGADAQTSEIRFNYYYGDKSQLGLSYAKGQEATPVGAALTVLADIESAALTGKHGLGGPWTLAYALTSVRQGNFYTRSGFRIGVEHAF